MAGLRNWKVTTDNGNTIGITARSKSQARKSFNAAFGGMGRVTSIEDDGPAPEPLPNPWKAEEAKKPVKPIKVKDRKQKPNERCACGSGKKYKKCKETPTCGGSGRDRSIPAAPVRPVQPRLPDTGERDMRGLPEGAMSEMPREGQER